ncbi:MAG: ABC transporter ATP-binding protein [Thermodesulfobacteriota bacterium]
MEVSKPILEVRELKTYFPIRRGVMAKTVGYVKAVDGVSFTIPEGKILGLVGESGCGKTTVARSIIGLAKPRSGEIRFLGENLLELNPRNFKPLRRKLQMIFQDPVSSLNPRMNVLDIVTEGLVEYGMVWESPLVHAVQLLKEVGLEKDAVYRYPHEFSGGQRQRISIARAISLKPDFIICDEPVSALDVSVQAQIINLLMDLRDRYGLSYLFISHDLSVVNHIADRIAVMYLGVIVEHGPGREVILNPMHPYTQALVRAIPIPGIEKKEKNSLKGEIPSPSNPPSGCRFHTRCPEVMTVCRTENPRHLISGERHVWCHLY